MKANTRRKFNLLQSLLIAVSLFFCFHSKGQGTAFTYQGYVQSNGVSVNGNYAMTFTLFSSSTGGGALAGPLTNTTVPLSNGLFTVLLDFGSAGWNGQSNWIEIGVTTNGSTNFITLLPRQPVTPAPYAIYAVTGGNASALSTGAAIGTGSANVVSSTGATTSFIGGGTGNNIQFNSLNSFIGGGLQNTNYSNAGYSVIGGGLDNSAASGWSFIGGGIGNSIGVGTQGVSIVGGYYNTNNAGYSTVAGGYKNLVASTSGYGFIGGGLSNLASGLYAVIPGGSSNIASGRNSFAAGQQAQATNQGSFVWADSQNAPFASTNTNSFNVRANGGVVFSTGGSGVTVDGASIVTVGSGVIQGYEINDGGASAYQAFQQAVLGVGGDASLTFSNLYPVATNGGAPGMTLTINGSSVGTVLGFSGDEFMSQPYSYVVEVQASSTAITPDSELGLTGSLSFSRYGRTTVFGGIVTAFTLASSDGTNFLYTVKLESPLYTLALNTDYRIYQTTTSTNVASRVYSTATSNAPVGFSISGTYTTHDSFTQYGETSLNFINRVLESEGVFYFFNQGVSPPSLVMGDNSAAYLSSPNSPFNYYGNSATNIPVGTEYIRSFQKASHQSTLSSSVNSYNFTTPGTSMLATNTGSAGVGQNYEFGNTVATAAYDATLAGLRQEIQTDHHSAISGSSTAPDLRAGYKFTLSDQTASGLGNTYLVTAVHHAGFVRVTNGVSTYFYGNLFSAIPASLNFRPPLVTPKPRAQPCSASIVGNAGDEITTDAYERVKVQFKWDRYAAGDQTSSEWIRVATPWGGNGRGLQFVPRIGDEVVVSFLDGDPDQPVVTGSLYNANNMPAFSLPGNKTQSGLTTLSSKGGGGNNVLRFEDLKGSEEILLSAQKDLNISVKNNESHAVSGAMNVAVTGKLTLSSPAAIALTGPLTVTSSQSSFSGSLGLGGVTNSQQTLSLIGGMNIDQGSSNTGTLGGNAFTFGSGSGEGFASKRTTGGNQYDLEFYTDFLQRLLILNNGNVGIGNSSPSNLLVVGTGGAYCNGTTWVNGSDRNSKKDIHPIDPREVLEKVSRMAITKWSYKVDQSDVNHIGPMAQDFYAAFGLNGVDDKHISTVDEGGVALAAIQGVNQKLENEIKRKDAEIDDLRGRLDVLEKMLRDKSR